MSLSFNGYKIEILQKALRVYIKRKQTEKAIFIGIELFLFECLDSIQDDIKEKIYFDNINNLMLIYLEEQGIASLNLIEELNPYFLILLKRQNAKNDRLKAYLTIIKSISENSHCRYADQFDYIFKYFYTKNETINKQNKKKINEYLNFFPSIKKIINNFDLKNTLNNKDNYENLLKQSFKNFESLYWSKMIDTTNSITKEQKINSIFGSLYKLVEEEDKKTIKILKEWYNILYNSDKRFLTYNIPLISYFLKPQRNGKLFKITNIENLVDKNLKQNPIKLNDIVFNNPILEDNKIENEYIVFPELSKFCNFSFLFLEKNIIDNSYLE